MDFAYALHVLLLSTNDVSNTPDKDLTEKLGFSSEEMTRLGKVTNSFNPALEQAVKAKALTVIVEYVTALEQRIATLEGK